MYSYNPYYYEYLAHHGVKGQKWGIRRYQPYTSGQKGVFKNLKRSYKSSVRSLKKERRKYEKEGDELAVASVNKDIKDAKKTYKAEKKGLANEFRKANWEEYKQDVVDFGSEKEIKKIHTELTNEQLSKAIERITREKDLAKVFMRDVNKEFKTEQQIDNYNRLIRKSEAVSKVATSAIDVTKAASAMKGMFKGESEHEKTMKTLDEEKARAAIRKDTAEAASKLATGAKQFDGSNIRTVAVGDQYYKYDPATGQLLIVERKKKK